MNADYNMENVVPNGVDPTASPVDPGQIKRVFSRIGFALFATMLAVQVVQAAAMLIINAAIPDFIYSPWYSWTLVGVSTYLAGYPLFYLMTKSLPSYKAKQKRWPGGKELAGSIVISFGAMYLFNFISLFLVSVIGLLRGGQVANPLEEVASSSSMWASLLFGCIFAPVAEELVFRKLLIEKMRPFGDKLCVFASAFLFALFHGNLSQLLYAFALGAIFAYITLRTGSCRTSILLHVIVNLFGMIIAPNIPLWGAEISPFVSLLATAALGGFVLLMILLSLVVFFLNLSKLVFSPPAIKVKESLFSLFFANPGVLCYVVLSGLCVIAILMI